MVPTIMKNGEWQIDELRLTIRRQRDKIDGLTAELKDCRELSELRLQSEQKLKWQLQESENAQFHYQKLAGELIEGNARLRAALAQIADSDCHYDPAATLMRIARDVLANEQKS